MKSWTSKIACLTGFPLSAAKRVGVGIGIAPGPGHKYIAAFQCSRELIEYTENITDTSAKSAQRVRAGGCGLLRCLPSPVARCSAAAG